MMYFVCEFIDGSLYRMDGECNYVDYSDSRYCVFKHVNDDISEEILMLVPHEQIRHIHRIRED